MKTLLAFFYNNFEFLYASDRYRITDSRAHPKAMEAASMTLSGETMTVDIDIDRGQISFSVAPTKHLGPDNWFWVYILREFLDGIDDTAFLSAKDSAAWLRDNLSRVEALFAEDVVSANCQELVALRRVVAERNFGRP